MDQSKKGFLPMLQGTRLSTAQCLTTAEDREKMSVIPYASAIGSIMYAMLCTRPDVNLAVSLVGRYQSNPGKEHWTAVKNILKYLKRTKDMFLVYGGALQKKRHIRDILGRTKNFSVIHMTLL